MKALFELPPFPFEETFGPRVEIVDPILDECCMPPHLGPASHDDFEALMRIVAAVNPDIVVELGTAYGNTVANICKVAPRADVFTVNALPAEQSGDLVTCELSADEIGKVYRNAGFADRVTQIFANTLNLDLSRWLGPRTASLGIIDACHDTGYVLNDFYKVKPFIRPAGTVLFHDTHPSMGGHLEGSYMACLKLRSRGFDVRHIPGTWWAIWQFREASA